MMNNQVIFAAAGNGKTYNICKDAMVIVETSKKKLILLTYTNEGVRSIEEEYKKQNLGVVDSNVVIKTWYSFLLSDLIKPYQCMLDLKYKYYKQEICCNIPENYFKSIAFYQAEEIPRYFKSNHLQYFSNNARDLRKDNVSALAYKCIEDSKNKAIDRLELIYSHIFIDELQDYGGWDLELFKRFFSSSIPVKFVGDYKQATFRTNNSRKNSKYRDDKIIDFFRKQESDNKCTLLFDNSTRRFNSSICSFVNTIYNDCESEITPCEGVLESADNSGVYIIESKYLEKYCGYYSPVILRWNKTSRVEFKHDCYVSNYGNSKGCTYDRVIIVPTNTIKPFIMEGSDISAKQTKSKFFVACTRAKHSIVFAVKKYKQNPMYTKEYVIIDNEKIPVYKYTKS